MKKLLTIILVSVCFFANPFTVSIAHANDFAITQNDVRFSKNAPTEGETIRIYATVKSNTNSDGKDLLGTVKFFDETHGKQINGDQPISILPGKTDDVFVDFKMPAGTINVKVQVFPFQSSGDNTANNVVIKSIYGAPDLDKDRVPDSRDTDIDGDKIPNEQDTFPRNPKESIDTDGDGIGNNADLDDDNDGTPDDKDAFPLDASEWEDSDHDGVGNNKDAYPNDPTKSSFPPVSVISEPNKLIQLGKEIKFNPEGSYDTNKGGSISKYTWTINDSTKLEGEKPTYTFKDPGKYKVTLTVTNNGNETSETSKIVYVADYTTYIKIGIVILIIALALIFGFTYTKSLKKSINHKKSKK